MSGPELRWLTQKVGDPESPGDPAQDLLVRYLREIQEHGHLPLLSIDIDDTLLPFGSMIGKQELEILSAYAEDGGHLGFNTLAPKEWLYLRVIDRLVNSFHQRQRAHLLSRLHWIVSGGREVFAYDSPNHSYRRIYAATTGTKAEGFLRLARYLVGKVAVLALYGDRFDDPDNDGNALGIRDIPLVINVGADHRAPRSKTGQVFVNAIEKGPATTLRHLTFLGTKVPVAHSHPTVPG